MNCKFYLEFLNDEEGKLYEVPEPRGWDNLTLVVKTAKKELFGRNSAYSDGSATLVFDSEVDKILEVMECYGYGAKIRLIYEVCGEENIIGELNTKGIKTDGCSYIDTNIVFEQKVNKLIDRIKTKAEVLSNETLNGEDKESPTLESVIYKSKGFQRIATQEVDNYSNSGEGENYASIFNLDSRTDDGIFSNFPEKETEYSFAFSNKGALNVEYNISLDFAYNLINALPSNRFFNVKIEWLHRNFDLQVLGSGVLYEENIEVAGNITAGSETFPGTESGSFQFNKIKQFKINNNQGDTLTFRINISEEDGISSSWNYTTLGNSLLRVTQIDEANESRQDAIRISEVGKQIIDYTTDNCLSFEIPEFESGGVFYDYVINNGYLIRGIKDKGFKYSFEQFSKDLNGLFTVGRQLYNDTVFMGTIWQFYKPELNGVFDSQPVEYAEEYINELSINNVQFKYNKTAKEELNTIDEFNTSAEINLPTDGVEKELKLSTKIIASGYLIEIQRRKQFDKEAESSSYDSDVFITNIVNTRRGLENRTTEEISDISELLSPETSYNIALNPLQILSRWHSYYGSALHYKTEQTNIKCVEFEQNDIFTCSVDDSLTYSGTSKMKFNLDKTDFITPIFEPIQVDLVIVGVTYKEAEKLKDDVQQKRGYHTFKNAKGDYIDLYVIDFEYAIYKQELKVLGYKKNKDYTKTPF